jgi:hypothetical protein
MDEWMSGWMDGWVHGGRRFLLKLSHLGQPDNFSRVLGLDVM